MRIKHFLEICAWLLCAVLVASACGALAEAREYTEGERAALDYLGEQLKVPASHMMKTDDNVDDIYSELDGSFRADSFPAEFDLRQRGVVTPVGSQNPWGTCWSFGAIAASESSLLSGMGLTADEYAKQNGEPMDLSEKHLAYFSAKTLPSLSDYPEGEYPYDPSQAGEGVHVLGEGDESIYNMGGDFYLATSSFASGVGILKEKYAPYQNSEGALDKTGDWSLPEEMRFWTSFELKDANVLPTPAKYDANGTYSYRPEGTYAIKSELLEGRAVGIGFRADQSMPEQTPEELRAQLEATLADADNITEEEKAAYIDARAGATDLRSLPKEELEELVRLRCRINDLPEDLYDVGAMDSEQLIRIFSSRFFSMPYDQLVKQEDEAAESEPYMCFVGEDPVIYAHYTYESKLPTHAVCIVGWDDTFPAGSFREGYQPPADGAWIVKNSWGAGWGNEGYFYLSYYDQTLCGIESFEFVDDADAKKLERYGILQYDYMPAGMISSTLFDAPVYAAAVYKVDEDAALQHVSTMTGDLNATVTVNIYLLDDGAESPTDGRLLESVTQTFTYAGYHRISLPENLVLPEGANIGITVLQRVPTAEGAKYALVNTSSPGEKAPEAYAELHREDENDSMTKYCVAVVNPGENYVSFEGGRWLDWRDAIDSFAENGDCVYMAYDNLPIKGYVYPLNDVIKAHELDAWVPSAGGTVAICQDCGYVLMDFGDDSPEKDGQ